jgi:hypothetical protein
MFKILFYGGFNPAFPNFIRKITPKEDWVPVKELITSFFDSIWGLIMPVI